MSGLNRWTRWLLLIGVGALLVLLFWLAANVLLLFFSAVLLALFLRGLSLWVSRRAQLPEGWSLFLVIVVLLAGCILAGRLLAPEISRQFQRLSEELPKAWAYLEQQLAQSPWGQQLSQWMPQFSTGAGQMSLPLNKASGVLSSTLGIFAQVVIVLFVGLYLAAEPARYKEGVVRLLPPEGRKRADEILDTVGVTLQRWLMGRLLLMATNAVATALGLWLLGVPLAITLGIVSGLLNFIPNLGPIIAAVPAVMLAFVEGPWKALYVALFYFGYQMLDGYVFTPLVQKRTVALPPALTIMAQVLMGVLLGAMGVLLAVPLAAMVLVLVKMIYLEDTLGEQVSLPGTPES